MPDVYVSPPYLRYSNPVDVAEIDKNRRAAVLLLTQEVVPHHPPRPISVPTDAAFVPTVGSIDIAVPHGSGTSTVSSDPSISVGSPSSRSKLAAKAAKIEAVASISHLIAPSGDIHIGWHCPTGFHVQINEWRPAVYEFKLEVGSETFSLKIDESHKDYSLFFSVDGETYGAYAAQNGPTIMKVTCSVQVKHLGGLDPAYFVEFDTINLHFASAWQQPTLCVGLATASFPDEGDPAQLKGNDHADRPKLRVTLNAPAHPIDGQTVFIELDDKHSPTVGRWLNGTSHSNPISFLIPPGQLVGEISGFLGTRKVSVKKTMSITAKVNGQNSAPFTINVNH